MFTSIAVEAAHKERPARAVVISLRHGVSLVGVASTNRDGAGYVMTILVANAVWRAANREPSKWE